MKAFYLLVILIIPLFSYAEGQAGLETVFYVMFAIPFLISTFVGGIFIRLIFIEIEIKNNEVLPFLISLILSLVLFFMDRLMYLFITPVLYIVLLLIIFAIVIVFRRKSNNKK